MTSFALSSISLFSPDRKNVAPLLLTHLKPVRHAMPPEREAALAVEEEDFVDAAALARMSSSIPSSSSSPSTTTVATTAQQQQQQRPQRQNHLRPLLRGLKLGLASSYYNVAELLRLRRLGEIVKVRGVFLFLRVSQTAKKKG